MESNIATHLASHYHGSLAYTTCQKVIGTVVEVMRLNNILVKVKFEMNGTEYAFRATLSEQEEGVLMMVEDRITKGYMISGLSGFLYQKPNVHGGLISKLNSFYFHVQVQCYDGTIIEIYFLGKEEEDYIRMQQKRTAYHSGASYAVKGTSNL